MSDMLGIASNAIGAYQRALSTVSNNIANVNTEGYSRQDVVLKDSAPKKLASMYIGTGVMLQNIKRQYDEFAESNLRNSNSDLSAQTPMVDYTKRVMDIMGDKNIGLSSALDAFFASASELSTDPASTVLRTSFLRSAEGVASRFGELSTQLDLVATETKQGLESVAAQINTLTGQLALINQSMSRSASLEGQPAELLDRRDLTLRQLSELVRTKVSFAQNGTVNVSLGATMTEGLVVNGQKARPIGINASVAGKTEFVLDPYGSTEPLPAISGGLMGGYQAFISQVLEPAHKNLDVLAQVFVKETNTIQRNGIDGYGQMGQDLFVIDGQKSHAANAVSILISDGLRVATAAQFRISEGNTNVTTTRATVKFTDKTPATALSNPQLVNNSNASAAVTFKVDGVSEYVPVTTLSAGVGATFYLDEMAPGQQLQVLTRDGRQVLGRALTETEKYQLFTPLNGFEIDANFSDKYLNKSGELGYRGLDMFYGAKAEVLYRQSFDSNGVSLKSEPIPALLQTSRITALTKSIPTGAMQLNGVALSELVPNPNSEALIAGMSFGSAVRAPFNFKAMIGGQKIELGSFSATNMRELRDELQAALRLEDGGATDIKVSLTNNEADLLISDQKGRDITNLTFLKVDEADDSNIGDVHIQSTANQVADWLNGTTKVSFSGLALGIGANAGFESLTFNLGGVTYDVDNIAALDIDALAKELQADLRALDGTADLRVVVEKQKLVIEDHAGREISDVKLLAKDKSSGATAGDMEVLQSVTSQSNVLASSVSEIRASVAKLDFTKTLTINGQAFTGITTLTGLVQAINDADIGLMASVHASGELVIEDLSGAAITVDKLTGGNLMNIDAGVYGAQVRMTQVARDWTIPATSLNFTRPLELNGQAILTQPFGVTDLQGLINAINLKSDQTGVVAYIDDNNDLKLSTTDRKGTMTISVGPGMDAEGKYVANALGQVPMDYDATYRLKTVLAKTPLDPIETDVRLTFGSYLRGDPEVLTYGTPADLSQLGLRTGVYVEDGCPDDLMLFVTGKGSAKVAVEYSGQPDNMRDSLRSQSLMVNFTAANRYTISDVKTGTVLADRHFDASVLEPSISFQGLQVTLSHAASVGDAFRIDGNFDGIGNNVNMLDMVALAKEPVTDGKTINNAYIDQINSVGNLSQQALITQEALQVVNDQAIEARDKVVGVNLDDEAAALVRYQQAYQAAAKALQVSGQLFDAIVQIS
jgi:flagellar hook-associated protein FlgK